MPKLWEQTIDSHRAAVREAVISATASLVAQHGVSGVTMSQVAAATGICRATLYKYFPDVESILLAWHEHQVASHVDHLTAVRDGARGDATARLRAVLSAYAQLAHPHDGSELVAMLHRGEHVAQAERDLRWLLADLLRQSADAGDTRDDVPPE